MTDGGPSFGRLGLLKLLIQLSEIDSSLAAIDRDRKRLEKDLASQKEAIRSKAIIFRDKDQVAKKKQLISQEEDKAIKMEQVRLTDRRKALGTFTNYKLQETALREIENNARQLGLREEALITIIDEADGLTKETVQIRAELESEKKEYDKFLVLSAETFSNLSDKEARYQTQRGTLLPEIPSSELSVYERTRARHPDSPLAFIKNATCSGCFIQIGPQVSLQVLRGNSLVKCPGCSRILVIEEKSEE